MKNTTPFFHGFSKILFGRPAISNLQVLLRKIAGLNTLSDFYQTLGFLVPGVFLQRTASGPGSRQRMFSIHVTFWAFLAQVLVPNTSCRDALRKVQAWWLLMDPDVSPGSSSNVAYTKARARLETRVLTPIHQHLTHRLEARVRSEELWHQRQVRIVDGTSLSMPDTAANQEAYPQPSSQKEGCGFPIMKMTAVFSLASGALLHFKTSDNHVHEGVLFREMIPLLEKDDVLLADRGFCSYQSIHELTAHGVDSVMRLHGARKPDLRKAKRLGPDDFLITWTKPAKCPAGCSEEDYEALPATMELRLVRAQVSARGFRTQTIFLVTTLFDTGLYPLKDLADLFFKRWGVELHFREIKITMGMDILRCKSPEMVEKEVWMHAIAYNIVRALMQQAAHDYQVDLCRISFKGTLDTLRHWSASMEAMRESPRKLRKLLDAMLKIIAEDLVPERPEREEPRAKKRRPKNYQLLTKPRKSMQYQGHRNRPKPALS